MNKDAEIRFFEVARVASDSGESLLTVVCDEEETKKGVATKIDNRSSVYD